MGYPMAQNISKFYKLKAYNRSYFKSKNLKSYNIYVCRTIEQVCENCDFLITMLPGDKEVLNISKKLILHMKKLKILTILLAQVYSSIFQVK